MEKEKITFTLSKKTAKLVKVFNLSHLIEESIKRLNFDFENPDANEEVPEEEWEEVYEFRVRYGTVKFNTNVKPETAKKIRVFAKFNAFSISEAIEYIILKHLNDIIIDYTLDLPDL